MSEIYQLMQNANSKNIETMERDQIIEEIKSLSTLINYLMSDIKNSKNEVFGCDFISYIDKLETQLRSKLLDVSAGWGSLAATNLRKSCILHVISNQDDLSYIRKFYSEILESINVALIKHQGRLN